MKKNIIFLIAAIAVVTTALTGWLIQTRINPDHFALFEVYIQATDIETNQPISVAARVDNEWANSPIKVEVAPSGTVRAVWIDYTDSAGSLLLTAEGYDPFNVPLDLRDITNMKTVSGVGNIQKPTVIKMARDQ